MKAKNTKTNIPEGWKMTTLGEVADVNPTEFLKKGKVAKYVAMESIELFTRRISNFTLKEFHGGMKFRNGDILFARITPCLENGKTSLVDILEDGEVGFGSTEFIVLREKHNLSDKKYLYYLALSPKLREIAIKLMTGSSGRQRVQTNLFLEENIFIPPLSEQRAIASVLSSFDDKIELLREQNKTLEAIAQALYKRWFVDFEFPAAEPNLLQLPSFQGGVPEGRGGINNSCPKGGAASDRIINNKSALKTFRKQLRNSLTAAEAKLWTHLQNKQLNGRKFRRQFSIDNYILDFYCPSEKLAIELDGEVHNIETQAKYDNERDLFLSYYGIKVLRFENKVVFENIDYLLECIKKEFGRDTASAATTPPFGHPSLKGGELKGYKSSGGKMINSELGEIPKGWGIGYLGDDILTSLSKTGIENFEGEKIYLDTAAVQDSIIINFANKISFKQRPSRANMQPKINSIWFAKMKNSKKAIIFDTYSALRLNDFILSTGFAGLDVKEYALYYLWNFITNNKFELIKDNFCNGTTMEAINNENIRKIKILIPTKEILELFSNRIKPLYGKINLNQTSIQTLSSIRDTLLPKLISGKIRVSTTPPFGHQSLEEEELEDK